MPASSFATCDACGTFVPDDTRGPVTVGTTPVRNVMGLPANLCPACRERWQGAPLMDLIRALDATDAQIRTIARDQFQHLGYAKEGPLTSGLLRTIARQKGEVRDALAFAIQAGGERQARYITLYAALDAAVPTDRKGGDWTEYERIAALLRAMS